LAEQEVAEDDAGKDDGADAAREKRRAATKRPSTVFLLMQVQSDPVSDSDLDPDANADINLDMNPILLPL